MKRFRQRLKPILFSLLALFILLICSLAFLLSTTPGLYTSVKLANLFLPGKLNIQKPSGQLRHHFILKTISYEDESRLIVVNNLDVTWHLVDLLHRQLDIKSLKADGVLVRSKPHRTSSRNEVKQTESFNLPELPIAFRIQALNLKNLSFFNQKIDSLKGSADFNVQHWQIKQFTARHQGININLSTTLIPNYPYTLKGKLTISSPPSHRIQLNGKFNVGGDINRYYWEGQFNEPTPVRILGHLNNGSELNNLIKWDPMSFPLTKTIPFKTGSGRLSLKGRIKHLTLDLDTEIISPIATRWRARVEENNEELHVNTVFNQDITTVTGKLEIKPQSHPAIYGQLSTHTSGTALNPFDIQADLRGESIDSLILHGRLNAPYFGHLFKSIVSMTGDQLSATAYLGDNLFSIKGRFPYQWEVNSRIPQPELLHPNIEGLKTSFHLKAQLNGPEDGQLQLSMNPGEYQLPNEKNLPPLTFNGGKFNAKLDNKSLSGSGLFSIDAEKKLLLKFKLPGFNLEHEHGSDQQLSANLKLTLNSLNFLNQISSYVSDAQGQLNMMLSAHGSLEHPNIKGEIDLKQGQMQLPKLGLKLAPVRFHLKSFDKQWTLKGSLTSNQRPLKISGQGFFIPNLTGDIKLIGNSVQLVNTSDYKISASPDIGLHFTENGIDIKGQISIPEAVVSPQSFSESVSLSDDVVYADSDQSTSSKPIRLDLNVLMGKNVQLELQGLKGHLIGDVRIKQEAQGALNASGDLSIKDGVYKAYGQNLIIDKGELLFAGGLITNPGINIRAVRRFSNSNASFSGSNQLFDFKNSNLQDINYNNNTTVGIQVSGHVNAPAIKLFSIPATLSQADILSMLLLGRPASQTNQAGGKLLLSAISALNLGKGQDDGQLLSQINQKIGLDFDMKSSSSYNQQTGTLSDSKSVVIGKAISKRLYLSYNIGLMQADANVLTLNYLLNKFFSIQVSASDTGNGIDFLYTYQKK